MFHDLSSLLNAFPGHRIAVAGDLMLDSYIWGKVDRISPEAPIPIVVVKKRTSCPGGAANVMRNVVTMGGEVFAFGAVGEDLNGKTLLRQLQEYGVDVSGIQTCTDRPTTTKQRIISASQQLLRIDEEDKTSVAEPVRQKAADHLIELMKKGKVDVVVLEDYAKGVLVQDTCQEVVDEANRLGIQTILDPNPGNSMVLKGLTMMKPNRTEASAMSGIRWDDQDEAGLCRAAQAIREKWNVENLVISLAGEGMALFPADGNCFHIPTMAREVYDVSGAGDTVVAAASLGLAAGGTPRQVVEIANFAAGIAVGKLGTATVSAEELRKAIKA